MKLEHLIDDSNTSFGDDIAEVVNEQAYKKDILHLKGFKFWTVTKTEPALWSHQKTAITTAVAYLNAKNGPLAASFGGKEAALLKLPTGTGKSGIIAVLARCLPKVRKVLLVTPRAALTAQLLNDVSFRFWGNIGFDIVEGRAFTGSKKELGQKLEEAAFRKLLPKNCDAIARESETAERMVVVGTHQALAKIWQSAEKGKDKKEKYERFLKAVTDSFDLVVVDEGHYEPAVSWSRSIREFGIPTILVSATPYRNDYKSFQVSGRYLYNFPHGQAVRDGIIRPPEFIGQENPSSSTSVKGFVDLLSAELPERLKKAANWFSDEEVVPKVMVRADDLETLKQLQSNIDKAFETESLLIHDRAADPGKRQFSSVAKALKHGPNAQFWLHQFKLMEGIDDPSFIALAILDLMSNERQLVQQIGRVSRVSKGDQRFKQCAWVITTPENKKRVVDSWERYKRYEEFAEKRTNQIVSNEVALPDRLLSFMSDVQYIDKKFRNRLDPDAPLTSLDIQLPKSAAIYTTNKRFKGLSSRMQDFVERILEGDRFKVQEIEGMPGDAIGISYYAWRNSPILSDRYFSEWKFGVFVALQIEEYVFLHDTERLMINPSAFGLTKLSRKQLQKVFPEGAGSDSSRLSRMSFTSLEMSPDAIRSLSMRTRAFEDVFTDLLDPNLVPSTAFGFVNDSARYIGFLSARFRESSERYVAFDEYVDWAIGVANELGDSDIFPSSVFERYAELVDEISEDDARPVSVLLDLSDRRFLEGPTEESTSVAMLGTSEPNFDDLCADVQPADEKNDNDRFTVKINGEKIEVAIKFLRNTGKYEIASDRLNELWPSQSGGGRVQSASLVQKVNASQSFRILVAKSGVVYSDGHFFRPKTNWRLEDGSLPILDDVKRSPCLASVTSEKGESIYDVDRDDWHRQSLFGLFAAVGENRLDGLGIGEDSLTRAIAGQDVWLCDDDTQEVADFLGFNEEEKVVVFAHAKHGNVGATGFSVTGLQVVGRQALASLAFMARGRPAQFWNAARWSRNVHANKRSLGGRNRVFRNATGGSRSELNKALKRACSDPSYRKEIWLVCSRTVSYESLKEGLNDEQPTNRLRQFVMHWDSLRTACARANVRLKLFCD